MSETKIAPAPGDTVEVKAPEVSAPAEAAKEGEGKPADTSKEDEMVSVKKSDYEAMKGRQSALDKKEQRIAKLENKLRAGEDFTFKQRPASSDDSEKEKQNRQNAEIDRAEKGLMGLALDPTYREVMDSNPVLRDMLVKNPLSTLPLYAPDALDADDAIDLIKEKLDGFKATIKPEKKPEDSKETTEEIPPAGGINFNPQDKPLAVVSPEDPTYKDKLKGGKTSDIAQALKYRLAKSFGRK